MVKLITFNKEHIYHGMGNIHTFRRHKRHNGHKGNKGYHLKNDDGNSTMWIWSFTRFTCHYKWWNNKYNGISVGTNREMVFMSQMKTMMQYVLINACARVHDEIYSPSHDFSLIAQGRSPSAINKKINLIIRNMHVNWIVKRLGLFL